MSPVAVWCLCTSTQYEQHPRLQRRYSLPTTADEEFTAQVRMEWVREGSGRGMHLQSRSLFERGDEGRGTFWQRNVAKAVSREWKKTSFHTPDAKRAISPAHQV